MIRLLRPTDKLLSQLSAIQVGMLSLALVAIIAAANYAAGYEITISIFYLIPIALATWYGSYRLGVFFSLLSAFIWYMVDTVFSGHPYSHSLIPYWNTGVRLALFLATTLFLTLFQSKLNNEKTLSRTDSLTGVMNGRGFTELAEKMFELSERHGRSTTFAYIDLDNFKQVNDELGHSEGDRVLRSVGETFLQSVRRTDVVGRLGGDEFAIVLPETNESGAKLMLEKLSVELSNAMHKHNWPVSFSIGVVTFNLPPYNLDEAIKTGDALMYRVKQNGKNNILFENYPQNRNAP